MFGFCYKNNKKESALTIYSDNLSTMMLIIFMCLVPFITLLIPWFGLYTKCILSAVAAVCIYLPFGSIWYKVTQKTPLLILSKQGIKPILTRGMQVDPNASLIAWDNVAKVFVYKAPFSYGMENTGDAGFRYIGIKLLDKNGADAGHAHESIVIQTVQTMIPYSNDIDIPLTIAHPFTKKLIKQLNYYYKQYREQKKSKNSSE
jgi:hypothetical protein